MNFERNSFQTRLLSRLSHKVHRSSGRRNNRQNIESLLRKYSGIFGTQHGLFLWKSCNVNGRRSQRLMAAPGMIIFPIKTFQKQLIARFFKNNIFPYSLKAVPDKMRRKDRKLKRLSMGKRGCNILSFGYVEAAAKVASWLGWLPTSFLAFGATRRQRTKKRHQSLSLIASEDHK